MPTITFADWIKKNNMKKRDAYHWLKKHEDLISKEIRPITQVRKQWVMCIDESVDVEGNTLALSEGNQ